MPRRTSTENARRRAIIAAGGQRADDLLRRLRLKKQRQRIERAARLGIPYNAKVDRVELERAFPPEYEPRVCRLALR